MNVELNVTRIKKAYPEGAGRAEGAGADGADVLMVLTC
jgi:hypothetical protein